MAVNKAASRSNPLALLGGFLHPNSAMGALATQIPVAIAQQIQSDRANNANNARYIQLQRGSLGQLGVSPDSINSPFLLNDTASQSGVDLAALDRNNAQALQAFDEASNMARSGEGALASAYDAGIKPITQGYQDRYSRGMALLNGLGDQAKADVNETFNKSGAAIGQSATSRGLAGTSVLPSLRMGNERERSAELRRLNEGLRREQLSTDASLSGDVLGAQDREFSGRINLQSTNQGNESNRAFQRAGMVDTNNQRRFNFGNQVFTNLQNTIANRNDVAPSAESFYGLMQGLGAASGARQYQDQVNANTFRNTLAGPVGAGVGAGLGAGIGYGTAGLLGGGFGALGAGMGGGYGGNYMMGWPRF